MVREALAVDPVSYSFHNGNSGYTFSHLFLGFVGKQDRVTFRSESDEFTCLAPTSFILECPKVADDFIVNFAVARMIARVVGRFEKVEVILYLRIQIRRLHTVQKTARIGNQQPHVTAVLGESLTIMELVHYHCTDV